MALQVYRIDRSLSGKVGSFLKPPSLPVMPMGGLAAMGNPWTVFSDLISDINILHKNDEISRFRDPRGRPLIDNVYYIRHPKQSKTDCLISASDFHAYIAREQIADLVSYIRANTAVRKLKISISTLSAESMALDPELEEIPLEVKASIKNARRHEVTIECERPLKASEKKMEYIWLNEFPVTLATVDEFGEGTVDIVEEFDLSFGMGAGVASALGISATCLQVYRYKLLCELA